MTFRLNGRTQEEKYNIARDYASRLLVSFPEYGDFKISDILEQKLEVGSEDQEMLMDSLSQIERVLKDKGYVVTARMNLLVTLTPKGREIRQANIDRMNTVESFEAQCDKVIRYITQKENKNKGLTSKEIGDALKIDVETVQLIAEKFHGMGLILLSSTNGFYHFHVKSDAEIFVRETSFQEQKNRSIQPGTTVTNINFTGHGNFVTLGSIVNSVITNTVKISEQGNDDIATALQSLAKSIADAQEIAEEEKKDYLEQIKTLSEQALLPQDQRLPKSILKPMINLSLGALNAVASVAQVWSVWGPTIKAFFQIPQ